MKPAIKPHLDVPLILAPERMSSIIRSPGGKHRLARDLVNLAPFTISEYREPFAGSAAVAFRMVRAGRTRKIWINDLDPGIANMWTVVRDDPAGLIRVLRSLHGRFGAGSKELFDLSVQMVESDDRTEAAAAFYTRNHLSMYGANGMSSYAPSHPRDDRGLRPIHINYIPQFSAWLQGARITNLDYREVLDAPGAGVMCFVDPPYAQVGKAMYPFGEADLEELARHVRASGHSCLITVDDSPANRVAFSDMHPILHAFMSNMGNIHKSAELVCANYTTPLYTVHARKIGEEIEPIAPVIMPNNDMVPVVASQSSNDDSPAGEPTKKEWKARTLFITKANQKKNCEWYTPPSLLSQIYAANDNQPFDIDPCSPCKGENAPVWARQHFTQAEDGLAQNWHGRVWLNPPYHSLRHWVEKAADAVWCRHMPDAPTEASAVRDLPLCEIRGRHYPCSHPHELLAEIRE
ncbi:DNA N-6-adenine-methyltransferase [Paramagnetospirillum magneticum]|uniref:site-specific DNA-methyltransferase (adenine-specific) n=1 Tax=Paramagnetospirillum magneticum (strain ATCC 700264 / AMB-1) TaxID=342108 RepID=Q2W5L4_PARM1|nr:DNA N-6-adenine-methyltransferase [Paramagnetospirillum magneticum]BAE50861.1 Site-specific DNA methylase [Paramagnetospirillum magneticum AMB-1]